MAKQQAGSEEMTKEGAALLGHAPRPSDLPSTAELVRWTVIALGVAVLLLLVAVLPAERGIDPTGLGRVLGLTPMGELKAAIAEEDAEASSGTSTATPPLAVSANPSASASASGEVALGSDAKSDVTRVTLKPNKSIEVKLAMSEGQKVRFKWSVDRGRVSYDLHADRPGGSYHSYEKGKLATSGEGEFVAAFDGDHGWFWRNRSTAELTITLETRGAYRAVREMK